jgi:hypothetical protein
MSGKEKVSVEVLVRREHYKMLEEIAQSLSLEVQRLIQQEVDNALSSAEVWLERGLICDKA